MQFAPPQPSRLLLALISVGALGLGLSGCNGSNTDNDADEPPPLVTTDCNFGANQGEQGLALECTIEGDVADTFIDPLNSDNDECTAFDIADAGLFTLFDQSLSVPVNMIYGAEGDENPGRVRIDVTLQGGSHDGQLGKTPPNCGEPPVHSAISTNFSGTQRTLIDKEASPMCVARSTYDPADFTQTLGDSGPDIALATRNTTEDIIARRIDLEVATAVNKLLNSGLDLPDEFVDRSGRCEEGYGAFDG